MGQRKIGTPSSSLEKINIVVMGKDDVGKSGQNDYHEQVVIAQCIMVLRQNGRARVRLYALFSNSVPKKIVLLRCVHGFYQYISLLDSLCEGLYSLQKLINVFRPSGCLRRSSPERDKTLFSKIQEISTFFIIKSMGTHADMTIQNVYCLTRSLPAWSLLRRTR